MQEVENFYMAAKPHTYMYIWRWFSSTICEISMKIGLRLQKNITVKLSNFVWPNVASGGFDTNYSLSNRKKRN